MNVIIVSKKHGHSRMISSSVAVLLLLLLLTFIAGISVLGYRLTLPNQTALIDQEVTQEWLQRLSLQSQEIQKSKKYTEEQLNALRIRLAQLQARLTRIDSLGERLIEIAQLDKGEFDFSVLPALGGPEANLGVSSPPDFVYVLDDLAGQIEDREQQLRVLNSLLGDRKIQSDVFVAGRPINRGWMSSRYGYRNDPFNGNLAWHAGVDFAGKEGSDIIAVASGVVTWSGSRYGYGNLVEINHGNGYVTRYAHCNEILVQVGDVVKKSDVVALMGSSGRSTGPHVHFEVLLNGKTVDPSKYINRVARF